MAKPDACAESCPFRTHRPSELARSAEVGIMCEAIDSLTDQFRLTPAEWRGCAEGGVNCQRAGRISMLNRLLIVGFFAVSSAVIGCSKKQTPTPAEQSAAQAQPKSEGLHASMSLLPNESGGSTQGSLVLPTG